MRSLHVSLLALTGGTFAIGVIEIAMNLVEPAGLLGQITPEAGDQLLALTTMTGRL